MMALDYQSFSVAFFEQVLSDLDPQEVKAQLEGLAGEAEPVLLCFERPPFTAVNWCHRRLVADWLHETLSLRVDEVSDLLI